MKDCPSKLKVYLVGGCAGRCRVLNAKEVGKHKEVLQDVIPGEFRKCATSFSTTTDGWFMMSKQQIEKL